MLYVPIVLILGILVFAGVIFAMLPPEKRRAIFAAEEKSEPSERPWPYTKRDKLLTAAELKFYQVLVQVLRHPTDPAGQPQCVIAMQVRVADVLRHKGGKNAGGNWQKYQNKIDRKHFDFVLVKPDTTEIVCAIELDDASHRRKDRRERDVFLDDACEDAGLPLVRLSAANGYDLLSVARNIKTRLQDHSDGFNN